MSEVVQPHRPDARLRGERDEALGHRLRMPPAPVLAGEDEAGLDPRRTPRRPLGVLREPVREQGADGLLVEVDPAVLTAGRLRRSDDELMP